MIQDMRTRARGKIISLKYYINKNTAIRLGPIGSANMNGSMSEGSNLIMNHRVILKYSRKIFPRSIAIECVLLYWFSIVMYKVLC